MLSRLFLIAALILFVLAGLLFATIITMSGTNPLTFIAFGLALISAAMLT